MIPITKPFTNMGVKCSPRRDPGLVATNSSKSVFVRWITPILPVSSHVATNVISSILINIVWDSFWKLIIINESNLQIDKIIMEVSSQERKVVTSTHPVAAMAVKSDSVINVFQRFCNALRAVALSCSWQKVHSSTMLALPILCCRCRCCRCRCRGRNWMWLCHIAFVIECQDFLYSYSKSKIFLV